MKIKSIKAIAAMALMLFTAVSCDNGDWEFDNFKFSGAYFAYQGDQNPIRTITLGDDPNYDTSLDNQHKFQIVATMGGVYSNDHDVTIDIAVDNSLCDGLTFKETGADVVPMPSNYYKLADSKIIIPKGKVIGGVNVELTDDYFNDPKSTTTNYVIPIKMVKAEGVDSILCGKAKEGVENPSLTNADDWDIAPKNYVLYAVKYISAYQSNYLRRGEDLYSGAKEGKVNRTYPYVEKSEVIENAFTTLGINTVEWARPAKDAEGNDVDCHLKLSFDGNGACTVTSASEGVTASGSGKFVSKGDKNSWGGKDRDVLYLDYQVEYKGVKCATKDTLVVRDRGVKPEWFTYIKK